MGSIERLLGASLSRATLCDGDENWVVVNVERARVEAIVYNVVVGGGLEGASERAITRAGVAQAIWRGSDAEQVADRVACSRNRVGAAREQTVSDEWQNGPEGG